MALAAFGTVTDVLTSNNAEEACSERSRTSPHPVH